MAGGVANWGYIHGTTTIKKGNAKVGSDTIEVVFLGENEKWKAVFFADIFAGGHHTHNVNSKRKKWRSGGG